MLSKAKAVETARDIMAGPRNTERTRLDRIFYALNPDPLKVRVSIPTGTPDAVTNLAIKSRTNYLPLIVKNLRQTMIVDGYRAARQAEDSPAWAAWQANRMDARQTGVHHDGVAYGVAYVVVTPGSPQPVIRPASPRWLTALYGDPVDDDWPIVALQRFPDGSARLYDEEGVYFLGQEGSRESLVRRTLTADNQDIGGWTFIDSKTHGFDVTPVVRYRDRMLTDAGETLGVVEPLLSIQDRVDETCFGLLVAQYYQAFKQRYIVGWTTDDENAKMKAKASELWTFDDADVKVGQLDQADLEPYLKSKDSAVGDMATIAQVPKQSLGQGDVANMSAEALAAMEAQRDREVREVETSFGESHEQMFELVCRAAGVEFDPAAQVRWRDATARSLAQTVDALVKLATGLGIPQEALWERIPDVTDTDIERWKSLRAQGDAMSQLTALLDRQNQPPQPPGPTPSAPPGPGPNAGG